DQRRKSLWPLVQRRERLHGDIQVLDIVVTQHQASGGPRKVHRAQRSFLQRVALKNSEAESFEYVSIAGVGSHDDDLLSAGGKRLQRRLRDLSRAAYHNVPGGVGQEGEPGRTRY